MANQLVPSSSSSSSTPSWEYDVFLSFRGEDTRTNFTSHLFRAFRLHGIRTFFDDCEIPKGEEISPTLLKAIENSRISVIVFSTNYASSRWCLDELVHILDCRQSMRQMTRPIFYKVDPSDVRRQTNSFGVAFADPSRKYPERVERWKTALTEAANLKGDHFNEKEDEAAFINRIVEEISIQVANRTCLHVARYPVGVESCAKEVEELLDVDGYDRRVVGIWGTSGIGKTTIAKAVYNAIAHKFEGSCFLADVSKTSASREGQIQLQKALLSKILRGAELNIVNAHEGISLVKNRLRQKKILLILDDVDKSERLKDWVDVDCFGEGSRAIITTKDKGLLESYGVQSIYEVQKLEYDKALELFSLNAFKTDRAPDDYLSLARRAVGYAQGLPLALNIIGSYLCNKSIGRWQAVLNSYESYCGEPFTDIQVILRKTYDAWDYDLQQVFLDIACFFNGEDEDYVLQMLRSSTLKVREDIIDVLVEKCIIAIEHNRILMHNLLEKMGKHIVYDESPEEPGKRSRLCHHEDVCDVLIDCRGTKKIRGIVVNLPVPKVITLKAKSFLKMVNLEFFINRNAQFSGRINYLPNSLRLFDLSGRSIITDIKHTVVLNMPSNFLPRHLVKFHVPYSDIRQLNGFKNLANLTSMNLRGCEFLEKIPDLSGSPNIIELDLRDCTSLVEVDDSVGFLDKLEVLLLNCCSKLTRLPTRLGLRSLKEIWLDGCTRLERFPEIEKNKMKSLTMLRIGGSGIRELPSSIAYLTGLVEFLANGSELQKFPDFSGNPNITYLGFGDCKSLVEVNDSIGLLDKLRNLDLSGCSKLPRSLFNLSLEGCRRLRFLELKECNLSESDFFESLDCWSAIRSVSLSRNNFVRLPDCISNVVNLETLVLKDCKRLREIPVLPSKLDWLDLTGCTSLEKIPELPPTLRTLHIIGCNLSESDFLVPLDRISKAVNLKDLFLMDCKRLREIPALPPNLRWLFLDGCTSLDKISKLPPSLEILSLCNCFGLSGDEVAKLENNLVNKEIDSNIIYPGNEVPKWFSYTCNQPTIIERLSEYERDEYDREETTAGVSEFRFEIPLKLQEEKLALSFVVEPSTHVLSGTRVSVSTLNNGKKTFKRNLNYNYKDFKATHVNVAIVTLGEHEQQGDTCRVVFRDWGPIKSCGVHCLLRNQDEPLHLSLRPTSSLGKRLRPRGSSDIVDDEYDQQQQWLSSSSEPADDHPKRRQIDPNVPVDIEEDEQQDQPSASDDP